MTHDYIKQEIPAEITELGGATVKLVNKRTVPLDTSIKEALDGNYVLGNEQLVRSNFTGLVKSMAEGVQRDGHARQIGDFITVYAQPNGPIDLDKGWDPLVNSMTLRVRLLNELEIDISNWTFRDVTPGKQSFQIDSVSTGSLDGVVQTGADVHLNGRDFPDKEKLRVSWACDAKAAAVPSDKYTADATRVNVDKSALATLGEEDDGKEIAFVVRGAFTTVKKTAIVKYRPIAESSDGVVKVKTCTPASVSTGGTLTLTGTGLAKHDDSWGIMMVTSTMIDTGETVIATEIQSQSDTEIVLKVTYTGEKPAGSHPSRLWVAYLPEAGGAAETLEVPYTFVIA